MHHFKHDEKIGLYKKIHFALKQSRMYIECDYMVKEKENFYFAEAKRMRAEQGIPENKFVHYDTPCTVENQIRMFETSGFKLSRKAWQKGNTVIIVNTK